MMKKLLLSILAGMMALGAMAQGGKFTVQGWFQCEGDSVTIEIFDSEYELLYFETRVASAEMLELSFDLEDAALLNVYDGRQGYQRHLTVPAIPGDTVVFYMEGEPYYRLGGSQFYIDYDEAVRAIEPQAIELYEQDADSDRYHELFYNYEEALLAYVEDHPDQEASAALLGIFAQNVIVDWDDALGRGDAMLTERVRNSVVANLYKPYLAEAEESGTMALDTMGQGGKFTVQGWFLCEGDSVTFQILDCGNPLYNEELYFETRAASAEMLELSFDLKDAALLIVDDGRQGYQRHQIVPAIPGDTVVFYMEGEPYYGLGGSQFYIDYDEAVRAIEPQLIELCESKNYDLFDNYVEALFAYVKDHPDQEASAALLGIFINKDGAGIRYDAVVRGDALLTERVRNSVAANLYKPILAEAKKRNRVKPK